MRGVCVCVCSTQGGEQDVCWYDRRASIVVSVDGSVFVWLQ